MMMRSEEEEEEGEEDTAVAAAAAATAFPCLPSLPLPPFLLPPSAFSYGLSQNKFRTNQAELLLAAALFLSVQQQGCKGRKRATSKISSSSSPANEVLSSFWDRPYPHPPPVCVCCLFARPVPGRRGSGRRRKGGRRKGGRELEEKLRRRRKRASAYFERTNEGKREGGKGVCCKGERRWGRETSPRRRRKRRTRRRT